jgi:hypothetical protein
LKDCVRVLALWLPRKIAAVVWGTTLWVVTPRLHEEDVWMLHNAYRRGSNVIALVCAPQPDFDALRGQGEQLGVTVHRTIWEKELRAL